MTSDYGLMVTKLGLRRPKFVSITSCVTSLFRFFIYRTETIEFALLSFTRQSWCSKMIIYVKMCELSFLLCYCCYYHPVQNCFKVGTSWLWFPIFHSFTQQIFTSMCAAWSYGYRIQNISYSWRVGFKSRSSGLQFLCSTHYCTTSQDHLIQSILQQEFPRQLQKVTFHIP